MDGRIEIAANPGHFPLLLRARDPDSLQAFAVRSRTTPQRFSWQIRRQGFYILLEGDEFFVSANDALRAAQADLDRLRDAVRIERETAFEALPRVARCCRQTLAPRNAGSARSGSRSAVRNQMAAARAASAEARRRSAAERAERVAPVLAELKASGITSLRAISAALTERRVPTPAGKTDWAPAQVARIIARLAD